MFKKRCFLEKEFLEKSYSEERQTMESIATILGVSRTCVRKNIIKYGIRIRTKSENGINRKHTEESKKKIAMSKFGRKLIGGVLHPRIEKPEKKKPSHKPEYIKRLTYENLFERTISSIEKRIASCALTKRWRLQCLERDNHKCFYCGSNRQIQVHHKKPLRVIIAEFGINKIQEAYLNNFLWDVENGVTLCILCHKREHVLLRKMEASK